MLLLTFFGNKMFLGKKEIIKKSSNGDYNKKARQHFKSTKISLISRNIKSV
jgi:hypothetical protein